MCTLACAKHLLQPSCTSAAFQWGGSAGGCGGGVHTWRKQNWLRPSSEQARVAIASARMEAEDWKLPGLLAGFLELSKHTFWPALGAYMSPSCSSAVLH